MPLNECSFLSFSFVSALGTRIPCESGISCGMGFVEGSAVLEQVRTSVAHNQSVSTPAISEIMLKM